MRINGRLTRVPLAWKTLDVPFREGMRTAMTIPWGDVASAYYSTGIGNIEVYAAAPPGQITTLRRVPLGGAGDRHVAPRLLGRLNGRAARAWAVSRKSRTRYVVAVGLRRRQPRKSRGRHADDTQRLFTHREHFAGRGRAIARGADRVPGFSRHPERSGPISSTASQAAIFDSTKRRSSPIWPFGADNNVRGGLPALALTTQSAASILDRVERQAGFAGNRRSWHLAENLLQGLLGNRSQAGLDQELSMTQQGTMLLVRNGDRHRPGP